MPSGGLVGRAALIMISQKAKYALRALVALARAEPTGRTPTVGEIAAEQSIPKKFLEQILLDLKHHGIVSSKRGKAGGYMLLKPANRITYGEILRMVDGPIALLPCLSVVAYRRCDDCKDEQTCEVRHVFAKVAQASRDILDQTTIGESIAFGNDTKILEATVL